MGSWCQPVDFQGYPGHHHQAGVESASDRDRDWGDWPGDDEAPAAVVQDGGWTSVARFTVGRVKCEQLLIFVKPYQDNVQPWKPLGCLFYKFWKLGCRGLNLVTQTIGHWSHLQEGATLTAAMAYGLLCGAFYCINLLSKKRNDRICEIFGNKFKALKPNGPTVFLNIYLMDWFEARGKRGEGTRFTWSSAVCSFQRSAAETESSNWPKHLKLSDAGDVGTWLDDKGGEGHLLGLGELKTTHWVVVVLFI